MRPLLVLLLVIAGLTAFLLTFDFGGSDQGTPSAVPGTPIDTSAADDGAEGLDVLRSSTNEREEVDMAQPVPAEVEERDPVASAGATNSLSGKVVNEQGKPVADALVTLTKAGRSNPFAFVPDRSGDRKARTNEVGEFSFQGIDPFKGYALVVVHPDYKLTERGSVDIAPGRDHEEPTIVLGPGVHVQGWVRDTGGAPVQNAKISLGAFVVGASDELDPNVLHTQTGSDGHYELTNVDLGTFTMTITADGYGSVALQNIRIDSMEEVQQDVELEVAEMIMGTVSAVDGDPLEGAKVSAYAIMKRSGKQSRSTVKTDENGSFVFDDIPGGTYTVLVNADGFDPDRRPRVESGSMDVNFRLNRQAVVSGKVVDGETGEPVKEFTVQFRTPIPDSNQSLPDPDSRKKVKSAKGEFELPCRAAGTYVVQAMAKGYAGSSSAVFTVNKGQDVTGITVPMSRGGGISGRIVDTDGKPISGALITTQDDEWTDDLFTQALGDQLPTVASVVKGKSKADGTFEISGLTAALYLIDVRHSEHARVFQRGISVRDGAATPIGDIRMTPGGTVQGKVYGPDGDALAGAVIQLSLDPGGGTPRIYSGKSASNGLYQIHNVHPGLYTIQTIRSSDAGAGPFEAVLDLKETRETVQVGDGQMVLKDFHLGMKVGGGK